jgi:hypothetical protein
MDYYNLLVLTWLLPNKNLSGRIMAIEEELDIDSSRAGPR